jgi:hypothetical protein
VIQGAANVPGYAIAYTPKDGPATPAVVIAPEAQSSPDAAPRPLSQTQPSKVRVAPVVAAPSADLSSASDDLEDLYPPKKKTGKVVAGVLGGMVVLLGVALGMRALSNKPPSETSATPVPPAVTTQPAVPAAPAATAAATPPAAAPATAETTAVVAAPTAEPTRAAPEPAPAPVVPAAHPAKAASAAKPARPKPEPAAAPAPRPTPRPVATASFPAEAPPAPAPKAAAGKSVIVRDAPF